MKITIKLILLFLIPGFLLFHGMYYIQTMSNLHNANNEISDIMHFVAEQCARYDNLIETDEVQTQIDLVEKTNEAPYGWGYEWMPEGICGGTASGGSDDSG